MIGLPNFSVLCILISLHLFLDRWVHLPSGRIYNLTYSPPKVPFKDDITGEALSRRYDDNPEIVRFRLKQYHEAISPILNHYRKAGILFEVQGKTSDMIYPMIKDRMKDLKIRKID